MTSEGDAQGVVNSLEPEAAEASDVQLRRRWREVLVQPAVITAVISATAAIACVFLTWLMNGRIDASISMQALAIENVRNEMSQRQLALEAIKVDIAAAAQRNSETATKLDEARYDLERESAVASQTAARRGAQNDEARTRNDEIRLSTDITKFSTELRPNISIACKKEDESPQNYKISCEFQNLGAHRTIVSLIAVSLLNSSTQVPVADGIEKAPQAFANAIQSGAKGSNAFRVQISPQAPAKPVVRVHLRADTDPVVIGIAKRLSQGALTDSELAVLSRQGYTYNLWL